MRLLAMPSNILYVANPSVFAMAEGLTTIAAEALQDQMVSISITPTLGGTSLSTGTIVGKEVPKLPAVRAFLDKFRERSYIPCVSASLHANVGTNRDVRLVYTDRHGNWENMAVFSFEVVNDPD